MIYLLYQSWENTESNHAGMKNMCLRLEEGFPEKYQAVDVPKKKERPSRGLIAKGVNFAYRVYWRAVRSRKFRAVVERIGLKDEDKVILTEYMDVRVGHIEIAKLLRRVNGKSKIFGISHLVPSKIESMFDDKTLREWVGQVDGIVTFGRSLSEYYLKRGVEKQLLFTTFHYVDDYYREKADGKKRGVRVLVQGNQMRDLDLLVKIIGKSPEIEFLVCQGLKDLSSVLDCPNVKLIPFVEESELRELMKECPISLNVMEDTIGSNVIVTSMGMSEAMICSDVGSIRDYCSEENCIFCKSEEDFIEALRLLTSNRQVLESKRKSSYILSEKFRLVNFEKEIGNLICRVF